MRISRSQSARESITIISNHNKTIAHLKADPRKLVWVIKETLESMIRARASEAAASMAYYGLFSLFPLLILLVTISSFFLQKIYVQQKLLQWFSSSIPGSEALISANIQQVLDWRSTFSLIALASLLWSASGVFSTLAANINRAWPEARNRSYVYNRLVAFGMVLTLAAVILVSLTISALSRVLPFLNIPLLGYADPYQTTLWKVLSWTVPPLFSFLAIWFLYIQIPNVKVDWRVSLIGALVTTILWRILTYFFAWYLSSGLNRYELVYGSLGALVASMFWAYLTSWIFLFGAHLTSVISRRLATN
jgi:membrane protein